MVCVFSIIDIIYASYYPEVNMHSFVKTLNFALSGNVRYIWHCMVLSAVLPNFDRCVKILSTSSVIIWSGEKTVLCNYVLRVHHFMQEPRNSVTFV